jgi:uncharacterized membrane protein required for colicin V production
MCTFLTIVIMLAIAYAFFQEGLFTAFTMFFNVFFAGLIAFNFWEPMAARLESLFADTFLLGYEDMICLVGLFCITLGALRTITNIFANLVIDYPEALQRGGGAVLGLATGYLLSGFFLCCLQTLPWSDKFMGFNPTYEAGSSSMRDVLPPDRVWLAMMCRAGAFTFATYDELAEELRSSPSYIDRRRTFDKYGTFELRYSRYRRYGEQRDPMRYQGEFDKEIGH